MRLDTKSIERIEEAVREIAILFIALAPLDVFLSASHSETLRNGLIFVIVGVMMFTGALFTERKRRNG
jgi:uncharacterized membrane protein YgdD (TMEM256/DUF423 family)